MDATAAASLLVARHQAEFAAAAAAKMLKMNADAGRQLVAMLEAGTENLEKVAAATASGVGANLDVTA